MKYKEIVNKLCKVEAGTNQVNIAQMGEVFSKLCDMAYEANTPDGNALFDEMIRIGENRAKQK